MGDEIACIIGLGEIMLSELISHICRRHQVYRSEFRIRKRCNCINGRFVHNFRAKFCKSTERVAQHAMHKPSQNLVTKFVAIVLANFGHQN